ncbi:MAG TPA: VWA domain-containing protein, partial [Blastocatellia bacterium]|nr:VWA domain-containing protein [Blastocatellia bacterium]
PNGDTSPPSVAGDDASLPLPYETSPGRSPDAGMAAMPKSKPELKRTPGEEEPSLIPASDETREGSTVNPAAGLGADRVATGKAAIRLGTTLVNLSVKTTDNSGRVVAGLKKDDFQVFENGSPQEIAYFDANTSPVNVLLMLDLSGSTHDRMKVLKKAAETFVDRLGTDDQIGVATFTGRFRYVSAFTRDHRQVKHQIGKIKNREGGTRFYDAMWSGLDIADAIQGRRKAIIVLTDGVDNSLQDPKEYPTTHTFSDLADRAAEDDVTIYPIYIDTEGDRSARSIGRRIHEIYSTARAQLGTLADDTAGTLLKTHDAGDLKDAYAQVAEELHTVYSIAYSPAAAATKPEWRKVAVKIDRPGVVVKTRAGYHTK